MLTVTEISCCPGIIGADIAPTLDLRASVLYTGIGGGSPASPTIIDFTPITFKPVAPAAMSAFVFALSIASFSRVLQVVQPLIRALLKLLLTKINCHSFYLLTLDNNLLNLQHRTT
jgi:hypothetical protein